MNCSGWWVSHFVRPLSSGVPIIYLFNLKLLAAAAYSYTWNRIIENETYYSGQEHCSRKQNGEDLINGFISGVNSIWIRLHPLRQYLFLLLKYKNIFFKYAEKFKKTNKKQ
jgi:hypothetical protein